MMLASLVVFTYPKGAICGGIGGGRMQAAAARAAACPSAVWYTFSGCKRDGKGYIEDFFSATLLFMFFEPR